jgi:hypothetical protein
MFNQYLDNTQEVTSEINDNSNISTYSNDYPNSLTNNTFDTKPSIFNAAQETNYNNLKINYNNLQNNYTNLVNEYNQVKQNLQTKETEITDLNYQIICMKTANLSLNDNPPKNNVIYEDDGWWDYVNLDKLELDARAKLNNEQTEIITKLRKRINKTRKYTKTLLKRNRNLENSLKGDGKIEFIKDLSFRDVFSKNEEFLFRNACMRIIYGTLPSIALWAADDTKEYDIRFWNIWSEAESKQVIDSLFMNYWEYCDLMHFLNKSLLLWKTNYKEKAYFKTLLDLVEWLFNYN